MKEKKCAESKCKTKGKVGGQAVIEGVMMRGIHTAAMAVRTTNGEIDIEQWEVKKPTIFNKIPFIRGVVNFVGSIKEGYRCLGKSADKAGLGDDLEPESKFDKWLNDHLGDKLTTIVVIVGAILGIIISIVLFTYLPALAVKGLDMLIPLGVFKALIEGFIKIGIFILYLSLASKNSDIKRMFEYHGAEHKTIFCFEAGLPLTVENVRKQIRFHPRCGTSFIIIVLIISILVFSLPFIPWDNILLRTGLKILMLPLIMGIAYEFIRLAGRYDNIVTRIISSPGLALQRITTIEPDDSQIEVAIAAVNPCIGEKKSDEQVEDGEN